MLDHLELPAIQSGNLRLLSQDERVDFGADGSLNRAGEFFVVLLNHLHRLDFLSHFRNQLRCTLKAYLQKTY